MPLFDRGRLEGSFTLFHVDRELDPRAVVTLDEGVSMLTNIVDCDFDAVKIGMKVKVTFKPTDGGPPVPMFAPA